MLRPPGRGHAGFFVSGENGRGVYAGFPIFPIRGEAAEAGAPAPIRARNRKTTVRRSSCVRTSRAGSQIGPGTRRTSGGQVVGFVTTDRSPCRGKRIPVLPRRRFRMRLQFEIAAGSVPPRFSGGYCCGWVPIRIGGPRLVCEDGKNRWPPNVGMWKGMPAFPSERQTGRRDGFFFIPIPMLLRRTGDRAAVLLRSVAESGVAEFPASGRGGGRYEDGCETVRLALLPEVSESRGGSSGSVARRLVPAGHRQKCITGGECISCTPRPFCRTASVFGSGFGKICSGRSAFAKRRDAMI